MVNKLAVYGLIIGCFYLNSLLLAHSEPRVDLVKELKINREQLIILQELKQLEVSRNLKVDDELHQLLGRIHSLVLSTKNVNQNKDEIKKIKQDFFKVESKKLDHKIEYLESLSEQFSSDQKAKLENYIKQGLTL
ncbi:hypothetical protein DID75_04780 [Candidatus Marinamargulisbacteria bacterium SCGC AG-410-N11]|nr:hypothetical protein DID75_04780 [Candidatus Marinamargulisbacteria bacterium SCGC AG-410-N11]